MKIHKVQIVQEAQNINTDINLDFEENPPFQECVISGAYQTPGKSFSQKPSELNSLMNTGNLVQNSCQNKPT